MFDNLRDSYLSIDFSVIINNLNVIKEQCSKDKFLFGVIKGNGYGHGLVEMGYAITESNADGMAVATSDEAFALREYYDDIKILNLGVVREEDYTIMADKEITVTVANLYSALILSETKLDNKLYVHLKINTGMNRIGFNDIEDVKEALKVLSKNKKVVIEGIFTHFATAEDYDKEDYLDMQIDLFRKMVEDLNMPFKYIHCTNSASLLKCHEKLDFTTANRVGIAMYGHLQDKIQDSYPIEGALELISHVTQVSQYPKGTKIGYSNNYVTQSDDEYIATIPLGYADGIPRKLTGATVLAETSKGDLIVGKIIGSICMDQTMISFNEEIFFEDRIYIISNDRRINVKNRALLLESITHEVLTNFGPRLPRFYFDEYGEIMQISNDLSLLGLPIFMSEIIEKY